MDKQIDSRITEAVKTIGSVLENDLDGEDCSKVLVILDAIHEFAGRVSIAKIKRHAGNIEEACLHENAADQIYATLPENCKW